MNPRDQNSLGVAAQAEMYHALLLGLQLMTSVNRDRSEDYDWMFRLFRKQHNDKFYRASVS
jgi:hypothetical protein